MEAEGAPKGGHVALVLGKRGSESVMTVAIANKIEKLRAGGMKRGLESDSAGISNWARW